MEIAQILPVTRFGAKTPNMLYEVCSWQLGDISLDRIPLRPGLLFFLMSSERSDHQSAGSLLDFVFLHETVSGAAWFGVCPQEHTVLSRRWPFQGRCALNQVDMLIAGLFSRKQTVNSLNILFHATVLEPTT